MFAVSANGAQHVKVSVDGAPVGEQDLKGTPDEPLSFNSPYKQGMKVQAEFSGCPRCTQSVVTGCCT